MINIFENTEITAGRDRLRAEFVGEMADPSHLARLYSLIDTATEWKYSTGPIFDEPPYTSEMAGFDGGRLLKKHYSSPFEARLKGVYSSGFLNGEHILTISPSKPDNTPLDVTFFLNRDDGLRILSAKFFRKPDASMLKADLIGLGRFYNYQDDIKVYVGVGTRNAYTILVYYCSNGKIVSASMATGPYEMQANYKMEYDDECHLILVSSGKVIWSRKKN